MAQATRNENLIAGADDIVRDIATGVGALTGEAFFNSLVRFLQKTLHCAVVFVGRVDSSVNPRRVDVFAVCGHGATARPFEYDLESTPCARVLEGKPCVYATGVQHQFPEDRMLVELGIQSYAGAPLLDSAGRALGILVALHDAALPEPDRAVSILQILAARAAAELERLNTEEQLKKNEQRFALAQSAANFAIWEWNIASGEIYWPDAIEQVFGLPPGQFDKTYDGYLKQLHPDDRDRVAAAVAAALVGNVPYSVEHRIVLPSGEVRWLTSQGTVYRDGNGRPVRMLGVVRDVTDRMRREQALKDSEARWRFLVENVPDFILRIDSSGRILDINRVLPEYAVEQVLASRITDFVPPGDHALVNDAVACAFDTHQIVTYSLQACGRPGEIREYETRVCPVHEEGSPPSALMIATDVTERVRAERELRESRERLEERVRERTADLEAVNQELEAFTYSVSHDLRAPLRAIDGFTRALEEDLGGDISVECGTHLARVRRAAQHMGHLIDALLRLSRVSRAELNFETVDLSAIVAEVAAALRESASGRSVEVTIAPGLIEKADAALIFVALENLLSNAFKFSAARVPARIEFHAARRFGERVYCVADNGVGFDMQFAGTLFGAFQRLHPVREFEGLGIGLATVKRIIHRHGGRVWAESAPDQGARFFFTLGAETSAAGAACS